MTVSFSHNNNQSSIYLCLILITQSWLYLQVLFTYHKQQQDEGGHSLLQTSPLKFFSNLYNNLYYLNWKKKSEKALFDQGWLFCFHDGKNTSDFILTNEFLSMSLQSVRKTHIFLSLNTEKKVYCTEITSRVTLCFLPEGKI